MKSNNSFSLKATVIAVITLLTSVTITNAQTNLVQNGSFESGGTLCSQSSNGPFYLGYGYVNNWTGHNIQFPSQSYNTGTVHENNATCSGADYLNGMSSYQGSRAIQLALSYNTSSGLYNGSRAIGDLTGALGRGCYWVCLQVSAHSTSTPIVNGKVQVVLKASGGGISERVIGNFTYSETPGWLRCQGFFSITTNEIGYYDKIEIRLNEAHLSSVASSTEYINSIIVDDINLSACTAPADILEDKFNYNYIHDVIEGGGGGSPVIEETITADGVLDEVMVVRRWDLYKGESPDPTGAWTHMAENSYTSLTPSYNSGLISQAVAGTYYKLELTEVTPCVGKKGYVLIGSVNGFGEMEEVFAGEFESDFEPVGDEFGEPEEMQAAPSGGKGAGAINESPSVFELSPNPPTNEITIGIIDNNPSHLKTAKCSVFDSKGALVIKEADISENHTINISVLPAGIYYVRIINNEKIEVQKFYKK